MAAKNPGELTVPEIAAGMNAAAKNAQRLANDASTLLEAGRFPTAAALACLSIEEHGKVSVLRGASVASSETDIKKFWRDFKSHTRKNVLWPSMILFARGSCRLADVIRLFSSAAQHQSILDRVKQSGFYIDFTSSRSWACPESEIDEQLASSLVALAKAMSETLGTVTTHELELWIRHVGSAPKDDAQLMKQAFIDWHASMQEAGLEPAGPNLAEQFISSGLVRKEV